MRKYNSKISEKVNESLDRRELVVHGQSVVIAIVLFFIISLGIFLGTSMNAQASSRANIASYHKYYTSIQIKSGDTLWSIADEYICDMDIDKMEYIAEICELNHISQDDIHAGAHIVVPYYSKDIR